LRSVLEQIWDSIPGKVPMEGGQDIGEHECDITGQGFGEDSGQSGERIVGPNIDARNGAIGEDDNGGDGVDVLLNLSCNALLVELILLSSASVGQPRCVEDANLGRRLCLVIRNTSAYRYVIVAPKFVKTC